MTICVNMISRLKELTLETISKLPKESTPDTPPCVIVQGYYEPGDGGGGTFFWDGAFNVDPSKFKEGEDFGTIIKPNWVSDPKTPGRWRRIFEQTISVKWFGAKGDMKGTAGRDKCTVLVSGITVSLIANEPVFVSEDEGKKIVIWNGDINARKEPLVGTIKKVGPDLRTVELNDLPTYSMVKKMCFAWGTDDTDKIQNTLDLAKETGFAVYLPPGHFVVTKSLTYTTDLVKPEERDEGLSYLPLPGIPEHASQYYVYPVMKHGLRILGAGMQVSFLHNLITTPVSSKDVYPWPRATIVIDGTGGTKCCAWQQTGHLENFHIIATGHIEDTVGIDLIGTWAYNIQNVAIMNMGFHGIVIRNKYNKGRDF